MLINMLSKHRLKQNEIKLKNRPIYQDNEFIFARVDGHRQYLEYNKKVFRVYASANIISYMLSILAK